MEGRQYRFWQIVVYLGGWAILNGVLFWLVSFWDALGRGAKLGLGAVPALTAFALAAAMWRLERFRLTFVALIVAIVAVIIFLLLRLAPGDPVAIIVGDNASPDQITAVRQRLGLARAFLRKPALLILDEATNALDLQNEAEIMDKLKMLDPETTIIVISHRPTAVERADRVIAIG